MFVDYCQSCIYRDDVVCTLLDDLVIGYCFMYKRRDDIVGE